MEVTQAAPGDPAIAPLASRFRGQHEDPVDDGHDLAPLLATPVDPLEVGEHADQELALRHGDELPRGELDGAAERASHQLAAGLTGQDGAAVEGIEQHVLAGDPRARDEVPGQSDTLHLEAEAAPHLDQDQRERDGDAQAAIEHLVEVAVPGIVVLLRVPREALLLEQILPQPVEPLERIRRPAHRRRALGEGGEAAEIGVDVEIGVLTPGDDEGGARQIDVGIGRGGFPRELSQ